MSDPIQDSKNEKELKKGMDLDTVLTEEIGQFGWYQLKTLLLAALMVIFVAWSATEYIFTTGRISTRCAIPGCDLEEGVREYSPSWILNAVPGTSVTSFDNCERFVNVTSIDDESCPAHLFDRDQTTPCDEYVYANTNTVVYDYDLACDEWRRSLIGTIRTLGVFVGSPLTGYLSDRWGRRIALVINAFNTCWLGLLRYFANTYIGFTISEFVEALLGSGGFSCMYILFMEVMGPKYRVAGGAAMNTFFSIGQATMALIAWAVPNWRLLTLTLYTPQIFTIAYYWLMLESVRWYLSKGRYDDAEQTLKKIAKTNGKHLSEKSLQTLRKSAEEERERKASEEEQRKNEPWLIVQVFRHKKILIRCCVSPVWWITNTFIYYGMSINSVHLAGNQYVNYGAVSVAEIPGYWTAVILMNRIGRRPVLIGAFWVCALCQIAYIFLPNGMYGATLTLFLIGKYSIAMVMTTVYVYTSELYPTKYRHSLFAFSSMIGRIGSMTAPLTPALGAAIWDELPFALFAGFALVSGALVFLTPETLGSKLPDTMEEASNINIKKNDP